MSLYVGAFGIPVNWFFWAMALLFFASLYGSPRKNFSLPQYMPPLLLLIIGGGIGALLHAWAHANFHQFAGTGEVLARRGTLRAAGSLGAYFGILAVYLWFRAPLASLYWPSWTRLIAAMAAGGFVARLGCVYGGCCAGQAVFFRDNDWLAWSAKHWALLDAVALLLTASLAIAALYRGRTVWSAVAALGYIGVRFLFEFLRPFEGFVINFEQILLIMVLQSAILLSLRSLSKGRLEPRAPRQSSAWR